MIEPFQELLDNFCSELELTNSPFDLVQKKFIRAYFTEQAVALGYAEDVFTTSVAKEVSRRLGEKFTVSFPYCNKEFKRQNERGFYGLKMPQELEEKQRTLAKMPDSLKEKEGWRKQNLRERAQAKRAQVRKEKELKKKQEEKKEKEKGQDIQEENKEDQHQEIQEEEESESELSEEEYVTTTGRKGALKVETPPKQPKRMIRKRRKRVSFKLPELKPEEQPEQKPTSKPNTRPANKPQPIKKPTSLKKPIKAEKVEAIVQKLHTEITKMQESESEEIVAVSNPNMEQQLQKRSRQVEQLKTQNAYLLKKLLEYKLKCEESEKKQKRQRVSLI